MTTRAPLSTQLVRRAESPGGADGEHAGGRRRAHVHQGVAEVDNARRRQPEAGGDRQRDRRVGLERRVRPGPGDHHEVGRVEQRRHDGLRRRVGLVGVDGQRQTVRPSARTSSGTPSYTRVLTSECSP